ncbi:MAG: glycoside hydrolase family 32 protein [Microbacter sp.]
MKKISLSFIICFSLSWVTCYALTPQNKHDIQQSYRPAFHFTPDSMWMNDPNGLVYYKGVYHLFYQYYPHATVWGPMHWGHATSSDLVHWKHLPIALYPDSLGYIFSGSAVVDSNNTSGLGTKNNPPLIAVFAYHNPILEKLGSNKFQYIGMAYSLDNGKTWTKYAKNPIVPNPGVRDFRDSKVIWDTLTHRWIMAIAAGDEIQFYASSNLRHWTFQSSFGKTIGAHDGVWECPDLFPLKVNGGKQTKWVLLVSINPGGPNGGSATQYFVGQFNGHQFTPDDTQTRWIDYGKNDYAGVTWSDIPAKDGRRIFLGWMSNWQYGEKVPTVKWRSAMTFPRTLSLVKDHGSYVLESRPIREIAKLHTERVTLKPLQITGMKNITTAVPFALSPMEMSITFRVESKNEGTFGMELSNDRNEKLIVGYDAAKKQLFVDRRKSGIVSFSPDFPVVATAPCLLENHQLKLHILIDAASIEVFAQNGTSVLTDIFFPTKPYNQLSLFSDKGTVEVDNMTLWKLK